MAQLDYYRILEVDSEASYEVIRRNYRRLVKIYHPDVNPSAFAKQKIVEITESFEVLSDPERRARFDMQLHGIDLSDNWVRDVQEDPYEVSRQEYIRKKRQKDKEDWYRAFKIKVKFYKYQRMFSVLFLGLGVLFTLDHYISNPEGPLPIETIKVNRWGNAGGKIGSFGFESDKDLYEQYSRNPVDSGYIHWSLVFDRPAFVSLDNQNQFVVYGTIYIYNNFFAYIIMAISLLMIRTRRYSDWILTLGLVPFFLSAFLILMMMLG